MGGAARRVGAALLLLGLLLALPGCRERAVPAGDVGAVGEAGAGSGGAEGGDGVAEGAWARPGGAEGGGTVADEAIAGGAAAVFTPEVIEAALEAAGVEDGFIVSGAQQVDEGLWVAAGHLRERGTPGLLLLRDDGRAELVTLPPRGAPGPAHIKGIVGDLVWIQQGHGYLVYNYRTGWVSRSDEQARVLE